MWFQFRLRTLLVVVAAYCVPLGLMRAISSPLGFTLASASTPLVAILAEGIWRGSGVAVEGHPCVTVNVIFEHITDPGFEHMASGRNYFTCESAVLGLMMMMS